MNVIWLASWFPNRTDTSTGDFIERHAHAVAPFVDKLTIIAVVKDISMPVNAVETIVQQQGNIEVHTVYYGKSSHSGLLDKFLSLRRNLALYQQAFDAITAKGPMPDLLHVHVAMKAGLFAERVKKKWGIPYIITEHWSGYNKANKPNIYDEGRLFILLTKRVLRNAACLLPVSKNLGDTITANFVQLPVAVIPNVVNTQYFFYENTSPQIFTFIHPSYFNYPKNPENILKACNLLKEKGYQFQLKIIGSRNTNAVSYAKELGLLNSYVFFEAAIPYVTVADRMRQSHALLMFSRYENLPCIILEALCCGIPVVSSSVGGIPEIVNASNGLLVQKNSMDELVLAMQQMIDNYGIFNREGIAATSKKRYSYQAVGKQILDVYKKLVAEKETT